MEMTVEDMQNIALLCLLLGIGVISFIGVAAIYICAFFLMDSSNDNY
jgi:phage shock protein PspC (stress-responsive transcriptional regulator)